MARTENCMDVTGGQKLSPTATPRYKYKAELMPGQHCRAGSADVG